MSDLTTNKYDQQEVIRNHKAITSNTDKISEYCYQSDGHSFSFGFSTANNLPAGFYNIAASMSRGIVIVPEEINCENILNIKNSISDKIIKEVSDFWDKEELYKKYKTAHRRGILFFGAPGTGKTSIIKLLIKDVIARKGIVLKVPQNFELFVEAFDGIRKRDPEVPIVVLMEDFERLAETNDSLILNTLDGVKASNKVVYVATTNHPERLGPRFMNRPKRFDTVIEIGPPDDNARIEYLKYVITSKGEFPFEDCLKDFGISVEKWIADTDGLTFAHLDELFTNVVLLGRPYEEILNKIKVMGEKHPGYTFNGKRRSDDDDSVCEDDYIDEDDEDNI